MAYDVIAALSMGLVTDATADDCDYPSPEDVADGVSYANGTLTGTLTCTDTAYGVEGELYHSPARIVAELLISAGFGIDGQDVVGDAPAGSWPIYIGREPDRPDDIIKVSNTVGRSFGDTMVSKIHHENPGIQIMIRARNEERGYLKSRAIATFIDQVNNNLVTITREESGSAEITYSLHAINRESNVFALGFDTPMSKRQLFAVNATCTIRLCCND